MATEWSRDDLVRGVPMDGREHDMPVRVSTKDSPAAIFIAARIGGVVQAVRDMDSLTTAPGADMSALLSQLRQLREVVAGLEEHVMVTWHERPTDRGSFADLGEALNVHRTSAAERYQRIKLAAERGLTAEWVRTHPGE